MKETSNKEPLLDSFVSNRPTQPALSEEEIINEVQAVRYKDKE